MLLILVWLVWFVGFILWLVKKNKHKNRVVVLKGIGVSQQVLVCSLLLLLTTGISVLHRYWVDAQFLLVASNFAGNMCCIVSYNVSVSYLRVKQVFFSLL